VTVTKVVGFDLRIPKHFFFIFLTFIRFYMEFTSLLFLKQKKKRKRTLAFRPLEVCFFSGKVPGGRNRTGEGRCLVFRRPGSPAARVRLGKGRGDRAAPLGALGSRGGGPRRRLHRSRRSAAAVHGGGGAPEGWGGGERAWEDQ